MTVDLLVNFAVTTLTAPIASTPAAGTVETWAVLSTALPFPQLLSNQQFRACVSTGPTVAGEIVIVFATVDATHYSVSRGAEGSTVTTHASGEQFAGVLTAGSALAVAAGYAVQDIETDSGSGLPEIVLRSRFGVDGSGNPYVTETGGLGVDVLGTDAMVPVVTSDGLVNLIDPTVYIAAATAATLSDLATHAADTTAVHGIKDFSQLALLNDPRFTDTRNPKTASVTNGSVANNAGIAETKLQLATDAAVGTGSRRTLGTGSLQAMPGNYNFALTKGAILTGDGSTPVKPIIVAGPGVGGKFLTASSANVLSWGSVSQMPSGALATQASSPTGTLAESIPGGRTGTVMSSSGTVFTAGQLRLGLMTFTVGTAINSLTFMPTSSPSITGSPHVWFVVYDEVLLTPIVNTVDDTSPTFTASTEYVSSFASPWTPTGGGTTVTVYVGLLIAGTGTMPTTLSIAQPSALVAMAPKLCGSAGTSLTDPTSAPNPVVITASGNLVYMRGI